VGTGEIEVDDPVVVVGAVQVLTTSRVCFLAGWLSSSRCLLFIVIMTGVFFKFELKREETEKGIQTTVL
jgi:hypothetical protein